ncbi:hypothetical protein BDW66DRAFT_81117 [Aspergillus desertorum]
MFLGLAKLWDGFEQKQLRGHPIRVLCIRRLRRLPPGRRQVNKSTSFPCEESKEWEVCIKGLRALPRPEDKGALEPHYNAAYTNPCSAMAFNHAELASLNGETATDGILDQGRRLRNCPKLWPQSIRSVGIARTSSCKGSTSWRASFNAFWPSITDNCAVPNLRQDQDASLVHGRRVYSPCMLNLIHHRTMRQLLWAKLLWPIL